ncbi:GNAT family N-acetyltransferase [Oceaniglobus ichthyenteri]|uniref:GNAT family N-acetyltransferase n=1 Tax=Oceaniglobus ichthyenteri TaxID=2136177 RepID=UPI0013DE326A|nr:GNAT family N-acetyltransferase [Oceaniglobus ichthyenteri]
MPITLRPATADDSALLLDLRNAPDVRAVSMDSNPIDTATHQAWFDAALANPSRTILIIQKDGADLGMVRFDRNETAVEVSIALAQMARGRGIGRAALKMALETCPVKNLPFVARIKPENAASLALFQQSGFSATSDPFVYICPRTP